MPRRPTREPDPLPSSRRLVALLAGPADAIDPGSGHSERAGVGDRSVGAESPRDLAVYYASAYAARDADPLRRRTGHDREGLGAFEELDGLGGRDALGGIEALDTLDGLDALDGSGDSDACDDWEAFEDVDDPESVATLGRRGRVDGGVDGVAGVDREQEEFAAGTDPFRAPPRSRRAAARSSTRAVAGTPEARGSGRPRREAPPLLQLPESITSARVGPRSAALLGMFLIVLVAAGLFAGRVWWSQRAAVPEPVASIAGPGSDRADGYGSSASPGATRPSRPAPGRSGATAGSGPATLPSAAAGSSGATGSSVASGSSTAGGADGPAVGAGEPGGEVVVHVVGAVRKPGVVTLPASSRVGAAIQQVGGLAPAADATSVNLARPVIDGEQIVVLARGAGAAAGAAAGAGAAGRSPAGAGAGGAAPAGSGAVGSGGSGPGAGSAPVDLNTADRAALDQLPGVGPVMADRIIAWRTEHGRFSSVDELGEVSGVGEKTLERLRPLVRV